MEAYREQGFDASVVWADVHQSLQSTVATASNELIQNARSALQNKGWSPSQADQDAPRLALNWLFKKVLFLANCWADHSWEPKVRPNQHAIDVEWFPNT